MRYHPLSTKDELTDEEEGECVVVGKKIQTQKKGFHRGKPEINVVFCGFKRRKKNEKSFEEITFIVEKVMAELEIVAEDDAQLNREGQPAIRKLQTLPLLRDVLFKRSFQQHFLDRGLLTLFKNWLEPLPDGSLPNANVRGAVLDILTDFPLHLEQHHHREQLKKSGLGRVIRFLSQSGEEISSNKRLAKGLIDKWSRLIFDKSDRFTDLRDRDGLNIVPMIKKPVAVNNSARVVEFTEAELDFKVAKEEKPSCLSSSSKQRASRPKPTPKAYVVRPPSKYNPEMIKAHARQEVQGECRQRIAKRLKQLKASNKRMLPVAS